ncbi:Uncharacterized conserved protein YafD, endonuclease/exonuclease/phosphatase (EEP) superfamily [Jatrophihabitans endophyticus]|uniref:Uncharacterized conserved protein YafD, endonuclease/exonuclease/phosphatase (EEP) superfamily n=1 Tax=Jatrophihabitans endophyticus TaxID=1206085 RepID=A0A1M5KCX5_9ACTN|nr:endonuclease/exonuclease/phosphatase family protein [Jatrophihabitans endophyticus]SHG50597.1 Uncharacterized conserved protein YafD, endonuclease/exonuclease/phosphatase (EEP) superfamily [Jatrophihabitans endophyticus]
MRPMRDALRLRRAGDGPARVVLTLLALGTTVVAWGTLVLHAYGWTPQWLLIAAALAHFAMWAAPVALVLAVLVRRWLLTALAVLATVLVLTVQLPPTIADTAPRGRTVRVLQANLRVGHADPAGLVRLVREQRADLLATEELTTAEARRLVAAGLSRSLPYHYLRPLPDGGSGSGIWSRWPLSGTQDVPGFWLGTVRARVAAPGGPLTFLAVHLTPPWPFPERRWLAEVPRLRTLLRAQPVDGPVLAAGDYNATVDHAQFRGLLADGYGDAAQQAGEGYLPSYPADRWYGPVIGIDHVLLRDATGTAARTLDLPNSDHRALLADVALH